MLFSDGDRLPKCLIFKYARIEVAPLPKGKDIKMTNFDVRRVWIPFVSYIPPSNLIAAKPVIYTFIMNN